MEDIKDILRGAESKMKKALEHTSQEFVKIRAGKASPNMLDSLTVDYYGAPTPMNQVAAVTVPDARSILVKPWEKKMIAEIERAIINSDLGLNPQNDGEQIRINIPPLSEDRRKQLVKQVKSEAESGKVSIRNVRKEHNEGLKRLQKDGGVSEDEIKKAEDSIQKLTDSYVKQVDDLTKTKEDEIMTV